MLKPGSKRPATPVPRLGGAFMPVYRLHFFSLSGGHLAHSYPFAAASDSEAFAFAEVWKDDAPMELWTEDSRLRRWEAPER